MECVQDSMVAQDSHQLPTRDLLGETGGRLLRAVVDLNSATNFVRRDSQNDSQPVLRLRL